MNNLFSTWAGIFNFLNPLMPTIESIVTFRETGDKTFGGFLIETPLILPQEFAKAMNKNAPGAWAPMPSVECKVVNGNILDKVYNGQGCAIDFVKLPDQLSGYPILCRGAFNADSMVIVGKWEVMAGDSPCDLPVSLKSGNFTFRKPDDDSGRKKTLSPSSPELLLA